MKIVFLPAVSPGDLSYGSPQDDWARLESRFPGAECAMVRFDTMVWYNRRIRAETMRQVSGICRGKLDDAVLVGFSKSGCGAANIALDHPGIFRSVVVFDAPLCNQDATLFGMEPFYRDSRALRPDVPALRIRHGDDFGSTALVLVSGMHFADQMAEFAEELSRRRLPFHRINDTAYPHNWNAGWLLRAIAVLAGEEQTA
jgi:pimeloyl-ACP methyl ester carboxylesterase